MKPTLNVTSTIKEPSAISSFDAPPLGEREFVTFQELILKETGISLSSGKRELLRSRLRKRLIHHGLTDFKDYCDLVLNKDKNGVELIELINSITTNKTDFFRESHHFTFLTKQVFPEIEQRTQTPDKRIRIWSAACSTGEEPYSIAITARNYFGSKYGWDTRILASDIDSKCLRTAAQGIYPQERIEQLPIDLKKKNFLRGKGQTEGSVRIQSELREMVTFRRINFADRSWPIRNKFDVIFCRNAMIYFDRDFQLQLIRRFLRLLNPHGYLFFGHSENLTWMNELESLGQTIYRPRSSAVTTALANAPARKVVPRGLQETKSASSPPKTKQLKKKSIIAGEVFASSDHMEISTLLGSCIAACLYDPHVQAGGMNHFMLPVGTGTGAETACYGINAMELLINEVMKLGGSRDRMVAKLYGGAKVMGDELQSSCVGERNIAFVREYLTTEGIPIVEENVGGRTALRVVMVAGKGVVTASSLEAPQSQDQLAKDKVVYSDANRKIEIEEADKITFF